MNLCLAINQWNYAHLTNCLQYLMQNMCDIDDQVVYTYFVLCMYVNVCSTCSYVVCSTCSYVVFMSVQLIGNIPKQPFDKSSKLVLNCKYGDTKWNSLRCRRNPEPILRFSEIDTLRGHESVAWRICCGLPCQIGCHCLIFVWIFFVWFYTYMFE